MKTQTSTITLLTPRGRGAVATLRFEGPCETLAEFFQAANKRPLADQPLNRIVFGHWGREVPEDVVLCRTAEHATEIHCHGGDVAAARIQQDLESRGSRRESWAEMLERTAGVFQREWTEAIAKATTKRSAGILLAQRELLPQTIRKFQTMISEAASSGSPGKTRSELAGQIASLLQWAEFGRHLTQPWDVVLGGPPNVGKSSLINALVGYSRSIVYDQPGTTRDIVTAETAFEGWPIRFADTAGLRDIAEPLEAEGIARAKKRLAAADCQILLTDISQPLGETDRQLWGEFPQAIFVAHKCDLPGRPAEDLPANALPVSSLTGQGVEELAQAVIARLIPQVPSADQATPFTPRQIDLLTKAHEAALHDDPPTASAIFVELLS